MPGRFSVRFFAVRRLPAVGIPVLKRAGRYGSRPFFVCVGGAPDLSAAMTRPPPPSFSAAPSCRSVLPLRPAAPSCCSVLPLRPAVSSYCPFLPPCLAALSCRPVLPPCSVLPPLPAALSCRLVLPPILLPLPAALSCCPVLPFSPSVSSCRPSYCPFLPLCFAALFCAPSCRSVLLSILLPRSAAPPSGFGRIRPDGACRFLALPSVRGKSACGETPFLHDLTRAATKKRPRRGSFSSCRVSVQPQI